MKRLIAELNDFLAKHDAEFKMIKKSEQRAYIISKLTKETLICMLLFRRA